MKRSILLKILPTLLLGAFGSAPAAPTAQYTYSCVNLQGHTQIDDKPMQVVQGSRPAGALATFYFDSESGLLTRLVRYATSRVGRLPTQIDYSEYRDVNGIKVPFHLKITWLDGQEEVTLTDIQLNAPVDAARFGKPASPKQ